VQAWQTVRFSLTNYKEGWYPLVTFYFTYLIDLVNIKKVDISWAMPFARFCYKQGNW